MNRYIIILYLANELLRKQGICLFDYYWFYPDSEDENEWLLFNDYVDELYQERMCHFDLFEYETKCEIEDEKNANICWNTVPECINTEHDEIMNEYETMKCKHLNFVNEIEYQQCIIIDNVEWRSLSEIQYLLTDDYVGNEEYQEDDNSEDDDFIYL